MQSARDAATIFICGTQALRTIGNAAIVDFTFVRINIPHNKWMATHHHPFSSDFIGRYMQLTVEAFSENKKRHPMHVEIIAASWALA